MMGVVKMRGGVLVLGVVTTAHLAAGLAEAQVDPGVSGLQALRTAVPARGYVVQPLNMGAGVSHGFPPLLGVCSPSTGPGHLAEWVALGSARAEGLPLQRRPVPAPPVGPRYVGALQEV